MKAPEPPEQIPKYIAEGLEKQDQETLTEIIRYSDQLIGYLNEQDQKPVEEDELPSSGRRIEDLENVEYDDEKLEEKDVEIEDDGTVYVETEGKRKKGTPYVKAVVCGKDSCTKCKDGKGGHGEYMYIAYRSGGKLQHEYVGKVS